MGEHKLSDVCRNGDRKVSPTYVWCGLMGNASVGAGQGDRAEQGGESMPVVAVRS